MKTLIVIPARYASTRFPAKPLAEIAGVSLLARVVNIAAHAATQFEDVTYCVATDHEAIAAHAKTLGAPVVMTPVDIPSGTDRAYHAALKSDVTPDFVVNLQGDAPFTPPDYIAQLIARAKTCDADVVTPVTQLSWDALDTIRKQKKGQPFSGTSCVRRRDGEALWFSKNILPAMRKESELRDSSPLSPVFRHIGLYGYRMAALERFVALPVGDYESLEGLEQLRFLENGMRVMSVAVQAGEVSMWGVDTPEDGAWAEEIIARHGDPYRPLFK